MYDYQMFRVVMRGFDRDEVLRYLRTHDEELNQRIAALEKELAVSEKKIRELKERISLKDSQRVELEHEIETKYKRYIENYDKIGALVYESQIKGDQMIREAAEKADRKVTEASREAERLVSAARDAAARLRSEAEAEAQAVTAKAHAEAEKELDEGRQKYVQIQKILNDTVEMINEVQRKFMSSYKDVHELVAEVPGSLKALDGRVGAMDMAEVPDEAADEADTSDEPGFETGELDLSLYRSLIETDDDELDEIPAAYNRRESDEMKE
ncbi:MAG: hypothetical protein PUA52_06290 [Lachnospiraceae bacterium]|nr:hypothetical protein [Lachnospiraceae bacterium]